MLDNSFMHPPTMNLYSPDTMQNMVYQLPKDEKKRDILMGGVAIGKSGTPTDFQKATPPPRDGKNKPKKRINIPKDELVELYYNKNYNATKIGEIYNCSPPTVYTNLRRYGLKPNRRINLTKEELYDLYWNQMKSTIEIGKIYGFAARSIYYQLEKYNVPLRSCSETNRIRQKRKLLLPPTKEELTDLYLNQKLSTREIGVMFRMSKAGILHRLKSHNIPIRELGSKESEEVRLRVINEGHESGKYESWNKGKRCPQLSGENNGN